MSDRDVEMFRNPNRRRQTSFVFKAKAKLVNPEVTREASTTQSMLNEINAHEIKDAEQKKELEATWCGAFIRCWYSYERSMSALDRADVKAMIDMLLVVFTLILSFTIAHMFTFEPEHLRDADKMFMAHVLNRSITDAEIDEIYRDGDTYIASNCHWFAGHASAMLGDGNLPLGDWDKPICHGFDDGKDGEFELLLPSFALWRASSNSISTVGTVLFIGILFYLILICAKPLEEDEMIYSTFIAITAPILLYMIILGCVGIAEFYFSLGYGALVSYPRINAGDVFFEYYWYFTLSLFFPACFLLVLAVFVAWYVHRQDEVNSPYAYIKHRRKLINADLCISRMIAMYQQPMLLNELLKDAYIKKPGVRLKIIEEIQDMANHWVQSPKEFFRDNTAYKAGRAHFDSLRETEPLQKPKRSFVVNTGAEDDGKDDSKDDSKDDDEKQNATPRRSAVGRADTRRAKVHPFSPMSPSSLGNVSPLIERKGLAALRKHPAEKKG